MSKGGVPKKMVEYLITYSAWLGISEHCDKVIVEDVSASDAWERCRRDYKRACYDTFSLVDIKRI